MKEFLTGPSKQVRIGGVVAIHAQPGAFRELFGALAMIVGERDDSKSVGHLAKRWPVQFLDRQSGSDDAKPYWFGSCVHVFTCDSSRSIAINTFLLSFLLSVDQDSM